jgi:hypothetical protein
VVAGGRLALGDDAVPVAPEDRLFDVAVPVDVVAGTGDLLGVAQRRRPVGLVGAVAGRLLGPGGVIVRGGLPRGVGARPRASSAAAVPPSMSTMRIISAMANTPSRMAINESPFNRR